MNTCIKVFKLLSVSDWENPGNRKTLTQKYLASHLSVIRGCLLLYGGTFNSGFTKIGYMYISHFRASESPELLTLT